MKTGLLKARETKKALLEMLDVNRAFPTGEEYLCFPLEKGHIRVKNSAYALAAVAKAAKHLVVSAKPGAPEKSKVPSSFTSYHLEWGSRESYETAKAQKEDVFSRAPDDGGSIVDEKYLETYVSIGGSASGYYSHSKRNPKYCREVAEAVTAWQATNSTKTLPAWKDLLAWLELRFNQAAIAAGVTL